MITQTGSGISSQVLIELDDNAAAEMATAMATGLKAIAEGGILASRWTAPRCVGGCQLLYEEKAGRYIHAPDCPIPLALAVALLCPEVLSNVKLIDECLSIARQSAETLPGEGETMSEEQVMNEEPTLHEFKTSPPLCPHCEKAGKRNPLTPDGRKLECPACGNVFWANDPTGAKSRNEVPK